MKHNLKIRDHFLSNEVFNVVEHSEGVLKTYPDLDEKTLDKYYDSSQYSSHYNIGGFTGFLYSLSAYIMLRFKLRVLAKHINKESLIVDFGCGTGGFMSYLKKKKYTVVGVDSNKKARDKCLEKNLKVYKSINDFKIVVLKIQSTLFLIFALFVIFTSNPFLVNSVLVEEGLGLNPILQDPALAVHPPMLYLGYVGSVSYTHLTLPTKA